MQEANDPGEPSFVTGPKRNRCFADRQAACKLSDRCEYFNKCGVKFLSSKSSGRVFMRESVFGEVFQNGQDQFLASEVFVPQPEEGLVHVEPVDSPAFLC